MHANTPSKRISSSCAKASQRVNFAHTIDYFLINGSWCTSQHCVYWVIGFLCQKYSQCLHDGKGTGLKCISVIWKSKETKFRPFSIKIKESYPKSNIFSIILGRIFIKKERGFKIFKKPAPCRFTKYAYLHTLIYLGT